MSRLLRNGFFYVVIFVVLAGVISLLKGNGEEAEKFNVQEFQQALNNGEIKEMTMQPANKIMRITGELEEGDKEFVAQIPDNPDIIAEVTEKAEEQSGALSAEEEDQPSTWVTILTGMIPFILIGIIIFIFLSRSQGGGGGGRVMNFGKSKAKLYSEEKIDVRFKDVAGADEEKQELVEVVEFLKDPRKFAAVGARIPKGVLVVGPPGTGKTLLAKAVAGESGTPFFSISGSDFVEMFVGVGASRVRDLFENAKKNAPCIIFIDEIDAVGRQRGAGLGGGHDEREQTLNQLLVEMDGFASNEGIIMIAATNRPDILDPALLRPGRFDRQIPVNRPDVKGREQVLAVHAKNKKLDESVELKTIAMRTPGFTGADLENLLNEAALVAARHDKSKIDMIDVDEATDRVIAGPAKKSRVISKKERNIVAYHESGHTMVGLVLDDADMVHKVTIVPRGQAGGYAVMLPREDRYFMTKPELFDKVTGLLGGRVAEEIIFGEVSTGAANDFQRATSIVRQMITEYGMSDKIGPLQFKNGSGDPFLGRDLQSDPGYSDTIAHDIDTEMQKFINYCYDRAKTILTNNKDKLELLAQTLLEVETLDAKQINSLYEYGVLPEEETAEEKGKSTPTEDRGDAKEDDDPKVTIKGKDDDAQPESYEDAKAKKEDEYEKRKESEEENKEETDNEPQTDEEHSSSDPDKEEE